jgi:Holliday junction resolvase RusA-like endonuclease
MGGKSGSRRIVLVEAGTRVTRPAKALWYRRVAERAQMALKTTHRPIVKAVAVTAVFRFPIAKSRLKGKRKLSPGDPHTQKPDGDKCLRGIFDPLKVAGVVTDDCVFFNFQGRKEWCAPGAEGADVTLTW